MKYKEAKQLMLKQALDGDLGSPENPIRNNSLRTNFWKGYFNHRSSKEYPINSISRACVSAGEEWSRNN